MKDYSKTGYFHYHLMMVPHLNFVSLPTVSTKSIQQCHTVYLAVDISYFLVPKSSVVMTSRKKCYLAVVVLLNHFILTSEFTKLLISAVNQGDAGTLQCPALSRK